MAEEPDSGPATRLHEGSDDWVVVGRFCGLHGVRGALKVYSWTEPRENILQYEPWHAWVGGQWQPVERVDGQVHGKALLARIRGVDDRDAAQAWVGVEIAVPRASLPPAGTDTWYWTDLVGCAVENRDGVALGQVTGLMETGAHDVLVTWDGTRERLIPLVVDAVIDEVDVAQRRIRADWHPED